MRLACALLLVSSVALAEPADPPKVVTQAWLREMNDAKWPLEAMIDWHKGVIVLDREVDSPREDYKGIVSARRICKPSELHALKRTLLGSYKGADVFNCANKPTIGCSFELAYEYTTITSLGFEKADDGTLRLSVVTFLDGGNQVESFYKEQAEWVSKRLKRLAKGSCDTK